jgi:hypothetical protein
LQRFFFIYYFICSIILDNHIGNVSFEKKVIFVLLAGPSDVKFSLNINVKGLPDVFFNENKSSLLHRVGLYIKKSGRNNKTVLRCLFMVPMPIVGPAEDLPAEGDELAVQPVRSGNQRHPCGRDGARQDRTGT